MNNYNQECAAEIGPDTIVEPGAMIGLRYHPRARPARIGKNGMLRAGTVIYGDVVAGDYFQSGHHTVIRAKVHIGNYCTVYNQSTLEGVIWIGDGVRIMSHVYIPSRTRIGNHVFIGPGCTFLNDKTPGRYDKLPIPSGATVEDEVVIGGGCTILPGVTIGAGSFVAAGALVTKDVPPWTLAKGSPAKIQDLPSNLHCKNNRTLTIQPLDFWHPLTPIESLPQWPSNWKVNALNGSA